MAKIMRKSDNDERKRALEHGRVFSMAQVEDVLELVATKQWPDAKFSDDECNLWSLFRRKLNIDF